MKIWEQENGYTLLETLVAFILLFIVLVPFTRVMTFLLSEPKSMEKIWVINLAEREMEWTLLHQQYKEEEHLEMIGRKSYLLKKLIDHEDRLLKIRIEVIHPSTGKVIFTLITMRDDGVP